MGGLAPVISYAVITSQPLSEYPQNPSRLHPHQHLHLPVYETPFAAYTHAQVHLRVPTWLPVSPNLAH